VKNVEKKKTHLDSTAVVGSIKEHFRLLVFVIIMIATNADLVLFILYEATYLPNTIFNSGSHTSVRGWVHALYKCYFFKNGS
jgi:hypothetical protein